MFKIRDLMVHTVPGTGAAQLAGGIICYWPSNDCCGPFWSNPGGGGPGNIGTTRWLTAQLDVEDCAFKTLRPGGCGLNYTTCPEGSVFTLRAHITNVVNPAELELLKRELDSAMELANQRQGELDEKFTPATREDIDRLETQLKTALKDLQSRREQLDK